MKKLLSFCLFAIFSFSAFAVQDTLFLDRSYNEVEPASATIIHVVDKSIDSTYYSYEDYNEYFVLLANGYVSAENLLSREGIVANFHKNGVKSSEEIFVNGEFDDILKQWDIMGNQKSIVYNFAQVEKKPEYPGGDRGLLSFIANHTNYPELAKEKEYEGKVFLQFVIDEMGKVTQVEIARGIHEVLDNEAVRVVSKLEQWTPGEHKGEKVAVSYVVPINFKLY
ncbi:MAG: energy transducer TonB [Bacteroidales bacterium]|jgi:TonB family protein|nr:energy transducer TonB [Bacteroidales bacterium]